MTFVVVICCLLFTLFVTVTVLIFGLPLNNLPVVVRMGAYRFSTVDALRCCAIRAIMTRCCLRLLRYTPPTARLRWIALRFAHCGLLGLGHFALPARTRPHAHTFTHARTRTRYRTHTHRPPLPHTFTALRCYAIPVPFLYIAARPLPHADLYFTHRTRTTCVGVVTVDIRCCSR